MKWAAGAGSGDEIEEGLGWRPARDSVALVRSAEVVEGHEGVEVALNLVGRRVPVGAALDAEALVEKRSVHSLDEAACPRRADLRRAVLDALDGQEQLVRMALGLPQNSRPLSVSTEPTVMPKCS